MNETWRDIEEYEGYYQVSDRGYVRSLPRIIPHKRYGTARYKGRVLKPATHQDGYQMVALCKGGGSKSHKTSRLVARAFLLETWFEGAEACHNDGNPTNNVVGNLRWDTHTGNMADKIAHGTLAWGERNGNSQVTEDQVQEIRRLLAQTDLTHPEVATRFGVSESIVSCINTGKSWARLPNPWGPARHKGFHGPSVIRPGDRRTTLTADDVQEIRRLLAGSTRANARIARQFGVTDVTIGNIKRGKTWSHLPNTWSTP